MKNFGIETIIYDVRDIPFGHQYHACPNFVFYIKTTKKKTLKEYQFNIFICIKHIFKTYLNTFSTQKQTVLKCFERKSKHAHTIICIEKIYIR